MPYSNVTPPELPAYDSETYGFYLLVFNYGLGEEDWYEVHLIYSSWRFQYVEGVGITHTGITFDRVYSDGTWSDEIQNEMSTLALNPGQHGQVYQRIYTNHNIFNGDELWLAENTVTPVDTKFDLKSYVSWLIAGYCSPVRAPKSEPVREPIAYFYGHRTREGETTTHTFDGVEYVGVVASDIYSVYTLELQEKYPYAFICGNWFVICENPLIYKEALSIVTFEKYRVVSVYGNGGEFHLEDGSWVPWDMDVLLGHYYPEGEQSILWTNHNIISEIDGTVYQSAADRIPIYE